MQTKTKVIILIIALVFCVAMVIYGTITEGKAITDVLPRLCLVVISAVIVIIRLLNSANIGATIDKGTMMNDINAAREWIVSALTSSEYQADYSMESLKDIDRFFDEQNCEGGILEQNVGRILFGIGVYVGETIISNVGGEWVLDNCKNETEIMLKINNETSVFPVLRVMARYKYGSENSIYAYGKSIQSDVVQ